MGNGDLLPVARHLIGKRVGANEAKRDWFRPLAKPVPVLRLSDKAPGLDQLLSVAYQEPKTFLKNDPVFAARNQVDATCRNLVVELEEAYALFDRCIEEQHSFQSMMLGLVSVRMENIRSALARAHSLAPKTEGRE